MHHRNWRDRAVIDAQLSGSESVHYTNVQTITVSDLPALKELLLKFISESSKLMRASGAEEAVAINCDLFKI